MSSSGVLGYDEQDLEMKTAIIDLLYLGSFPQEAPVLRFGRTFDESSRIFEKDGTVNWHVIHAIPSGDHSYLQ